MWVISVFSYYNSVATMNSLYMYLFVFFWSLLLLISLILLFFKMARVSVKSSSYIGDLLYIPVWYAYNWWNLYYKWRLYEHLSSYTYHNFLYYWSWILADSFVIILGNRWFMCWGKLKDSMIMLILYFHFGELLLLPTWER